MRVISYQCDICKRTYHYNLTVNDNERGTLLRLPEFKIEICLKCKKELLKMIEALKEHYVQRGK